MDNTDATSPVPAATGRLHDLRSSNLSNRSNGLTNAPKRSEIARGVPCWTGRKRALPSEAESQGADERGLAGVAANRIESHSGAL